jgi:hypothetical protein
MKMRHWKIVAGIILVFLVGFLSGIVTNRLPLIVSTTAPAQARFAHLSDEIVEELNLNKEQQQLLHESIEQARQGLASMREELRPKVDTIWKDSMERILSTLNETQKEQLEELIQNRRRGGRGTTEDGMSQGD